MVGGAIAALCLMELHVGTLQLAIVTFMRQSVQLLHLLTDLVNFSRLLGDAL